MLYFTILDPLKTCVKLPVTEAKLTLFSPDFLEFLISKTIPLSSFAS